MGEGEEEAEKSPLFTHGIDMYAAPTASAKVLRKRSRELDKAAKLFREQTYVVRDLIREDGGVYTKEEIALSNALYCAVDAFVGYVRACQFDHDRAKSLESVEKDD